MKLKAVKAYQLKCVNLDTTVQQKEVRFPPDARLYDRARQPLVDASKERGIALRQNYNRKQTLLDFGAKSFHQRRKETNKTYSVHAPEVECISKGKAHKRYEFGCKVSVAATSPGGWFVGVMAVHGSPYDGHTITGALSQKEKKAIVLTLS